MPAIGNLKRLWRATAGSIREGRSTIAADDFNGWMRLQPGSNRLSGGVRKQVNGDLLLQINQDRAVALSLAPGPLIDPKHAHGRRHGQRGAANQSQEGIGAAR